MTGKIYLVGIGPGSRDNTTRRAVRTIKGADVIVGHKNCLERIADLTAEKEIVAGNMSPVERTEVAVQRALSGHSVAIVTTGDPGVYAIASTLFTCLKRQNLKLDVVCVPGLPAANVAAALLGSPMGYDFATVSLTDKGIPWKDIIARIEAAVETGFVIVLYNPVGKSKGSRLQDAVSAISRLLEASVPVGIVTDIDGKSQQVNITTLAQVLNCEIESQSVIIVGNSKTFVFDGKMVTPRKYIKGIGY